MSKRRAARAEDEHAEDADATRSSEPRSTREAERREPAGNEPVDEATQLAAASESTETNSATTPVEGPGLEHESPATEPATTSRTPRHASGLNDPRAVAATPASIEAATRAATAATNLGASAGAVESSAKGESLAEMAARKLERAPIPANTAGAAGDELGALSALDESIEVQADAPETSTPSTAKSVEPAAARAPEAASASASNEGPAVAPRAEGAVRTSDSGNVAARAPESSPSAHSALDADRAAEVLRQVRMRLTPELRQAVIQLEPRELGRISIRLSVARGVVRAEMRAESPAALEALERHTPELKAALERAGLGAEAFSLELGFAGSGAEHDSDANGASNARSFSSAAPHAGASPDALRAVARRITAAAGGVDTYA